VTIFLENTVPETPMAAIITTQRFDAKEPLLAEKAKAALEKA
jgi:hypothetical protein